MQFHHALKTRKIIPVHKYKGFFVDVFINIQDIITVIIAQVKFT